MIGATMPSVQQTASEAITKLIYTYAERIDAGDFAGVAEVFAHATLTFEGFDDARAELPGAPGRGRDAVTRLRVLVRARVPEPHGRAPEGVRVTEHERR